MTALEDNYADLNSTDRHPKVAALTFHFGFITVMDQWSIHNQ